VTARQVWRLLAAAVAGVAAAWVYRRAGTPRAIDAGIDGAPGDDARANGAVTTLNGELAALRAEISGRLSAQQLTIGAYLTAAGVVTGLVLNEPSQTLLLLLIPLLAAILGSAYLTHSWTINHLGGYIRDVATPFLRERTEETLPSWEEAIALAGRNSAVRALIAFLTFMVFAATSAVALAASYQAAHMSSAKLAGVPRAWSVAWWLDLVLVLVWAAMAISNATAFWRPVHR